MGNLALLVGGDELGRERQADALPSLRQVNVGLRYTLVPYMLTVTQVIGNRAEEVLLVHQQMVACRRQIALHHVTEDGLCGCRSYATVVATLIVVAVCRLGEVTVQHGVSLEVSFCRRCID